MAVPDLSRARHFGIADVRLLRWFASAVADRERLLGYGRWRCDEFSRPRNRDLYWSRACENFGDGHS